MIENLNGSVSVEVMKLSLQKMSCDFFEMKLLLFKIILLSNLIMLFVIQSYETLLVILQNFVDNISISYGKRYKKGTSAQMSKCFSKSLNL